MREREIHRERDAAAAPDHIDGLESIPSHALSSSCHRSYHTLAFETRPTFNAEYTLKLYSGV